MRFLSLLVSVLAMSHSTSASSNSVSPYISTVNNAGGWGHSDVALEAGRYEPRQHQWRTMAEPGKPEFTYSPYDMETGPSFWGTKADPKCGGFSQSPVALPAYMNAKFDTTGMLKPLTPMYGTVQPANSLSVKNTGHALQVDMPVAPNQLMLRGGALGNSIYNVVQMHLHGRSEHSINGAHYPLEIHIVHRDDTRAADDPRLLTVVGIMVQEGPENAVLKGITDLFVPMDKGLPNFNTSLNRMDQMKMIPTTFSLNDLLPTNRDYYHYNGSLTTPPCSEQVVWHVLTTPITASRNQILALTAPFGTTGNARPPQALNARTIMVTSFQTKNPNINSASTVTMTLAGVISVVMALFQMQ